MVLWIPEGQVELLSSAAQATRIALGSLFRGIRFITPDVPVLIQGSVGRHRHRLP